METIRVWAVRLAEEAAPDEVELAPFMAESFARGGKHRAELLGSQESVLGGFGPTTLLVVFPTLLAGIAAAAPVLLALLAAQPTSSVLDATKNALGIVEMRMKARGLATPPPPSPLSDEAPAGFDPGELHRVISIMRRELRSAGLDADCADATSLRLLCAMLREPTGAADFVRQITSNL